MFSFDAIEAADATAIEAADFLLVLNQNENVIPAVAKMEGPQAAAFFMLGETTGTAAGGSDEEGKFLRVPGTNPFFPMHHDHQGNRFLELLERNPIDVYVMNTGRVGGKESVRGLEEGARSRTRRRSSRRSRRAPIEWEVDPDFGYLVAASVPGIDAEDIDILQPRRLYEATGPGRRVRPAGGAAQDRAGRVPGPVPEPVARDRGFGRVAERLPTVRDQGRGPAHCPRLRERRQRARHRRASATTSRRSSPSVTTTWGRCSHKRQRAELIGTVATRTLLQLHLDDGDTNVVELLWRDHDGPWLIHDCRVFTPPAGRSER